MPETRPPPPTGTTTTSTSGRSWPISRPTVPWPADDERVVERMDEHAAGLLLERVQPLEDLRRPGRLLVDARAVAQGRRRA